MHTIKIKEREYNIPLSWDDVTYELAAKALSVYDDKTKILSTLTEIPVEIIDNMIDADVSKLFELISFHEDLEVFKSTDVLEQFKDFDFGSLSYGMAEKCRQIMNSNESGYLTAVSLIRNLVDFDVAKLPLPKVIGTVNFFLHKSINSMIVLKNWEVAKERAKKQGLVLTDSMLLEALQHTASSQTITS